MSEINPNILFCLYEHCGSPLPSGRRKFCSRGCSDSHKQQRYRARAKGFKDRHAQQQAKYLKAWIKLMEKRTKLEAKQDYRFERRTAIGAGIGSCLVTSAGTKNSLRLNAGKRTKGTRQSEQEARGTSRETEPTFGIKRTFNL